MPIFHYKGYRQNGKEAVGTITADSFKDARSRLKGDGILPVTIDEEGAVPGRRGFRWRRGTGKAELALVTRRLATLLGASLPLFEAIAILIEQEPPGPMRSMLSRVKGRLAEGKGLAASLAPETPLFSDSYLSLVAAGEASGTLDIILDRLADFLEEQEAIKSRVLTALLYPLLMALVGSGVVLFLLAFVIPKITAVFADNRAALPLITVVLLKTSSFLRQGWWLLLLAAAGTLAGYRRLLRSDRFRLQQDLLLLRIPLCGALIQKLLLARFARILGMLLASGVPVIRSLEITAEAVVNRAYRATLNKAKTALIEGGKLSTALAGNTLFPPLLLHLVGVGEQSGTLEAMLHKAGAAYEREFDTATTRLLALLEPLMVLAMGLAVGFLVVAVLLPIFQLNQLVR